MFVDVIPTRRLSHNRSLTPLTPHLLVSEDGSAMFSSAFCFLTWKAGVKFALERILNQPKLNIFLNIAKLNRTLLWMRRLICKSWARAHLNG